MEKSQSSETVLLASRSPETTRAAGIALASTLYEKNTAIWLRGGIGAGKTTLVKGLGLGLGLGNVIKSPTYALEDRYGNTLLHMDLFRLDPEEARTIVEASEEFPGVRAIECPTSARPGASTGEPTISIDLGETSETERTITITFHDLIMPDRGTIEAWREEVRLPNHIARHSDVVGRLGKALAQELIRRGVVCRPEAVRTAGELHDLLRFVDFVRKETKDTKETKETKEQWGQLAQTYGAAHEEACARFLEERRRPALATIVRPHGLRAIDHPEMLRTTEQKLLFYADKRVLCDRVVPLDERFDDFVKRYGNGVESEEAKRWRKKTKKLERELFGENVP